MLAWSVLHAPDITALLEQAANTREVPGAVAVAGTLEIQNEWVVGVQRYGGQAVSAATRYDLASLTKVVATLPAVLQLVGKGEIVLEDKVKRFFGHAGWFQEPPLANVTIRQLLTHTSGLPAWKPLFALVSERHTAFANVLQTELEQPGAYSYSDLGFILLGAIVERVAGERQDVFVKKHVFDPLGMSETGYGPVTGVPVAATEDCGWRGEVLEGTVHDENAFVLDGVAGHAGLFGTSRDLSVYAQAWLEYDPALGPESLLQSAVNEHTTGEVRRGLGWQLADKDSSAGSLASDRAYGHTGFTGTSLWIEPAQGWYGVLLSNRVHPSRFGGQNIHALRRAFYEAVARRLKS